MGDRKPRFHCDQAVVVGQQLELDAVALRHAQVLRVRPGDAVELFDGRGGLAQAQILVSERRRVTCSVQTVSSAPEPRSRLTLLVGMTKGDKADLVVRMATELGVAAVDFVYTQRSVAKERGREGRLSRLQMIALEACAQSGNLRPPKISIGNGLLAAAGQMGAHTQRIVFWERADRPPPALASGCREICAVVGPEGGLSQVEVNSLVGLGFVPSSFGTPILRAETACVVAAARLSAQLSAVQAH